MKNTRKILVGAIAAAALAASSVVVYAQPAGPGAGYGSGAGYGPGAGRGSMGYGPGAGRGGMWGNPAAAVEGHLAALKVELKITPDQEMAWQAFTTNARQQADTMIARRNQMFSQAPGTTLSAPERLAQRTEFAKQRIAGMETMTAAVKDLYAVLTPEQKAIADRQLAHGPMGGGGRGMGGGRGFRG
jgi:Spy/CpxP family protein refolding chaperone